MAEFMGIIEILRGMGRGENENILKARPMKRDAGKKDWFNSAKCFGEIK